jgi:hypothetical protein
MQILASPNIQTSWCYFEDQHYLKPVARDVWELVFKKLETRDLCQMETTCKTLRTLLRDRFFKVWGPTAYLLKYGEFHFIDNLEKKPRVEGSEVISRPVPDIINWIWTDCEIPKIVGKIRYRTAASDRVIILTDDLKLVCWCRSPDRHDKYELKWTLPYLAGWGEHLDIINEVQVIDEFLFIEFCGWFANDDYGDSLRLYTYKWLKIFNIETGELILRKELASGEEWKVFDSTLITYNEPNKKVMWVYHLGIKEYLRTIKEPPGIIKKAYLLNQGAILMHIAGSEGLCLYELSSPK